VSGSTWVAHFANEAPPQGPDPNVDGPGFECRSVRLVDPLRSRAMAGASCQVDGTGLTMNQTDGDPLRVSSRNRCRRCTSAGLVRSRCKRCMLLPPRLDEGSLAPPIVGPLHRLHSIALSHLTVASGTAPGRPLAEG
jgi:hypothetical protein